MFDKYARAGRSLQVQDQGLVLGRPRLVAVGRSAARPSLFRDAPPQRPSCSTGSWRSSGSAGSSPPLPERRRCWSPTPSARPSTRSGWSARSGCLASRAAAASRACSSAPCPKISTATPSGCWRSSWRRRSGGPTWRYGRPDRRATPGTAFYYKATYPTHSANVPSGRGWSLVHGITRQESSFDQGAVSHAGARGMMQLMPGTAREQAGKMGIGYDYGRLTSDPNYNVMLGSAYFQRLVNMWDGNYPLAVASYNAGCRQCPQVGQQLWRPARQRRHRQLDRENPVRGNPRLCPAGAGEQRRL